ncbi:MAG TPA: hypothetical protein VGM23_03040, partial [Armatimonadota bacterium]
TILATEYTLYVRRGFGLPSQYFYRIAVKVPPDEVDRWLNLPNYEKLLSSPQGKIREEDINPVGPEWKRSSKPEFFQERRHGHAIVYRKEGIIILLLYSD